MRSASPKESSITSAYHRGYQRRQRQSLPSRYHDESASPVRRQRSPQRTGGGHQFGDGSHRRAISQVTVRRQESSEDYQQGHTRNEPSNNPLSTAGSRVVDIRLEEEGRIPPSTTTQELKTQSSSSSISSGDVLDIINNEEDDIATSKREYNLRFRQRRREWWKLSSLVLNSTAALLVLYRGVVNSASLFWFKDLTQLNVDQGYCIGWYLEIVDVEDAVLQDTKVTFLEEPICPNRNSTELTQEGYIVEDLVTTLNLTMLYVSFVVFLFLSVYPIIKGSLILTDIWPPCIKFQNCLIEIVAVSCLLGLMIPMLSLNPCPGDEFYCPSTQVFQAKTSPFCVRCNQFPRISVIVWITTLLSSLVTIIMLALGETPWFKKFGKFLGGFRDTNLKKNMFLKLSLYIFACIAIVNIMTILSSPSSIFVLFCIFSLVILVIDNLIQYFLSRRRFKFVKTDKTLLKLVRLSESDVDSSILLENRSTIEYDTESETEIDKVDVPQQIIIMMADEKQACLNLFSSKIMHEADVSIDIFSPYENDDVGNRRIYDSQGAVRTYKINQNIYRLESVHEESYSLSVSLKKKGFTRLNEERCIACDERCRSILMVPCNHVVFCRQCYDNAIRVRTADRELEVNRISRKVGGRHKFIQACFQKLRRFGKEELRMLQMNDNLNIPEANRAPFVLGCPLCRQEITETILLLEDQKRNRIRGKLLHSFDYVCLDESLDLFHDQRLASIQLLVQLQEKFSVIEDDFPKMETGSLYSSSSYYYLPSLSMSL